MSTIYFVLWTGLFGLIWRRKQNSSVLYIEFNIFLSFFFPYDQRKKEQWVIWKTDKIQRVHLTSQWRRVCHCTTRSSWQRQIRREKGYSSVIRHSIYFHQMAYSDTSYNNRKNRSTYTLYCSNSYTYTHVAACLISSRYISNKNR